MFNTADSRGHRQSRPALSGVLETALIVEDVARTTHFYRELFGFDVLAQTDRLCSLNEKPAQVLLLFQSGGSLDDIRLPGGVLPGTVGSTLVSAFQGLSRSSPEPWSRTPAGLLLFSNSPKYHEDPWGICGHDCRSESVIANHERITIA